MIEYPVRIVVNGMFFPNEIVVEVSDFDALPDEVSFLVERRWKKELERNPRLTAGPLLAAKGVSVIDDGTRLKLSCGVSNYKNFMGTTHESIAPFIDQGYWHRAIGMLAVTITSDGYFLMGVRSPTIDWGLLRHVVPAGRLKPSEHDPYNGIYAEYEEELGMTRDEIRDLVCIGVVEDLTWGRLNYEFVFVGRVDLTAAEVIARAKDAKSAGEHCQLEAFPNSFKYVRWWMDSDPNGFVPTGFGGLWLAFSGTGIIRPYWNAIHKTYEEHMGRRLQMIKK